MKRKLTDDNLRQMFIDTTYNNVTQASLANQYGVSQATVTHNLKYYMLGAYVFDASNPNLSKEEKAKKFGLTNDQYRDLVFRGKSKLMR